jgi:hypothetical protein
MTFPSPNDWSFDEIARHDDERERERAARLETGIEPDTLTEQLSMSMIAGIKDGRARYGFDCMENARASPSRFRYRPSYTTISTTVVRAIVRTIGSRRMMETILTTSSFVCFAKRLVRTCRRRSRGARSTLGMTMAHAPTWMWAPVQSRENLPFSLWHPRHPKPGHVNG